MSGFQRIAVGVGLALPRSYYERKLVIQQLQWRSNPHSLINTRTVGCDRTHYSFPSSAIIVKSHPHSNQVLLFDGEVRTRLSPTDVKKPITGPFHVFIDPVQREKFLYLLGLDGNDIVHGRPVVYKYGLYIQRLM